MSVGPLTDESELRSVLRHMQLRAISATTVMGFLMMCAACGGADTVRSAVMAWLSHRILGALERDRS